MLTQSTPRSIGHTGRSSTCAMTDEVQALLAKLGELRSVPVTDVTDVAPLPTVVDDRRLLSGLSYGAVAVAIGLSGVRTLPARGDVDSAFRLVYRSVTRFGAAQLQDIEHFCRALVRRMLNTEDTTDYDRVTKLLWGNHSRRQHAFDLAYRLKCTVESTVERKPYRAMCTVNERYEDPWA